jgi:hypothetical protein
MVSQALFESDFSNSNVEFLHEAPVISGHVSVSAGSIWLVKYWLLMFAIKKERIVKKRLN